MRVENKLNYYPELNGIRAIAAFMVILFHYFSEGPFPDIIKKISVLGQTGVTLFFVLSGFLMTRILINEKSSPNFFKVFYIGRILRIFPLYYFFLILFYILSPILSETTNNFDDPKWTFFVFLQNIPMTFQMPFNGPGHFWSLAVEEHFYLVLPILVFFLSQKALKYLLYIIILLAILFRVLILSQGFEIYQFTLTIMDGLAIGSLLAIYEKNNGFSMLNPKKIATFFIILIIVFLIFWLAFSSKAVFFVQIIKFTIIAFVFLLLILFAISSNDKNIVKKLLLTKFMQFSGKISFGLYVFHPLCFLILQKEFRFNNILVDFLISIFTTFSISSLSFYLFEAKFLKIKKARLVY